MRECADARSSAAASRRASSQDSFMANTPSAKKAVRQIQRRTKVNKSRRSQMRTHVKKVEQALASGNHEAAKSALQLAEPLLMRAAQKGIVHKNTASRKISRLTRRLAGISK
jgi:small subunit ribosomal protein S20